MALIRKYIYIDLLLIAAIKDKSMECGRRIIQFKNRLQNNIGNYKNVEQKSYKNRKYAEIKKKKMVLSKLEMMIRIKLQVY